MRRIAASALLALALAGCGDEPTAAPRTTSSTSTTTSSTTSTSTSTTTTSTTGVPATTATTTAAMAPTTAPAPSPAPTTRTTAAPRPAGPPFRSSVEAVDAAALGASWREGCPVGPADLRRLRLAHWGFDGAVHEGELVVHADVADEVVRAFAALHAAGFPIERMAPVDRYGGDDDASMAANNTSAFNCRPIAGTSRWSEHAYGRAIDVNPVQNPYVRGDDVQPPAGRRYLDRGDVRPGMLVPRSSAVQAFKAIGWGWGGDWSSAKDHQHVSKSGR